MQESTMHYHGVSESSLLSFHLLPLRFRKAGTTTCIWFPFGYLQAMQGLIQTALWALPAFRLCYPLLHSGPSCGIVYFRPPVGWFLFRGFRVLISLSLT